MDIVTRIQGGELEDLVWERGESAWNQTVVELDRLSRSGQTALSQRSPGRYGVRRLPRLACAFGGGGA